MNSTRFIRLWPFAAALGVVVVCLAAFLILERQAALDLWG
jgi:hypothetical protein